MLHTRKSVNLTTPGTLIPFWRPPKLSILDLYAVLFWVSIVSFLALHALIPGLVGLILAVTGTASCGFSWLFARAVFRHDAGQEAWPIILVGLLVVTGALLRFASLAPGSDAVWGAGLRIASNLHSLLGSTVLLLSVVEVFSNYNRDLPQSERRFRWLYLSGYLALMGVSVIWLRGAADGSWLSQSGDTIRMSCASLALLISVLAWHYRRGHPLPKLKRVHKPRVAATREEADLATRIASRLQTSALYLEPDLKLARLARHVNAPEYKVSQCITGPMGYRNFNHMINRYRIDAAKQALGDPAREESILTIALASGFSSIGPFNRAFKTETGVTPRAYRARYR